MRSPAAVPRRPPVRRPPRLPQPSPIQRQESSAPDRSDVRSGAGSPQASHRPLQLELFGGGRSPQASRQPLPSFRPQSQQAHRPFPRLPSPEPSSGRSGLPRAGGGSQSRLEAGAALPGPQAQTAYAELFRRLSRLMGGRLRTLSLTDNRRTILSVRPAPAARPAPAPPSPIHLRIHHSFAGAPDPVLRAVAAFLASAKGSASARQALAAIREHFHHHRLRPRDPRQPRSPRPAGVPIAGKPRRQSLSPVGAVLDLREIAADLNQRYFEGRLKVRITWGKAAGENAHPASNCRRTRSASLQLGSYSYEDRLIRIHRVLDRPGVPRYVVESVVHHELLHADLPPVTRNGRRYFHTPEFRRRERHFRHFERADCWVRENLQLLLRARRDAAAHVGGGAGRPNPSPRSERSERSGRAERPARAQRSKTAGATRRRRRT
jgi:hypothetical protein